MLSRRFTKGDSRMQEKSRLRQTVGTHQVSHTHTAWPGLCLLPVLKQGALHPVLSLPTPIPSSPGDVEC